MRSLQNLLFTLCITLRCVTHATKKINVSGYEGGQVTVSCPYDVGYESHEKYLCRNDCGNDDVLISTSGAKKNKYSIHDDKGKKVVTATISSLHLMDAGEYWCGVSRTFALDIYTAVVKVKVVPEWCCVRTNQLSGIVGRPVTLQCPYPAQHRDNSKFLCKGDHRKNCSDMVTSQSRFTLHDDASSSSFLVVVTELQAGDAGTYWCGSDSQWSPGQYTKIELSVVFPQQSSTVTPNLITEEPAGSQSTHIPDKNIKDVIPLTAVIFTVPAAVLLILVFTLVMIHKCKVRGSEVNVKRNKAKMNEAGETMGVITIYEVEDVACSDKGSCKPQSMHCRTAGDVQQEPVYQNLTTEPIYCNEFETRYRSRAVFVQS